MTLPRKGSRSVAVDGRMFRWMLSDPRKREVEGDPMRTRCLATLTVQEDVEEPGHVLQHELSWLEHNSVTPEVVRTVVRRAMDAGWNPSSKSAFRLNNQRVIVENIMT
jgi:hypothetical protein